MRGGYLGSTPPHFKHELIYVLGKLAYVLGKLVYL
jgi:hypothetical protein